MHMCSYASETNLNTTFIACKRDIPGTVSAFKYVSPKLHVNISKSKGVTYI